MAGTMDSEYTFEPADARRRPGGRAPCLTVLFHPDPGRIGERARLTPLLDGTPIELSRSSLLFAPPGGSGGTALDDRRISRKPILLGWNRDGELVVDAGESGTRVVANGRHIDSRLAFDTPALEEGVVLELADRVVLLLHVVRGDVEPGDDLGIIGANDAIEDLRHNVLRVADLPVSVLIRGETGSGKELVARAIHRASARATRPCVTVNMAAIPDATAASELFGHSRGAFTGAAGDHDGYFGQAEGGTLFLDEIGATPAAIQTMLLRALESGEIQPLGRAGPRRVDVRIIAATDADLEQSAEAASFSAALLHRLEGYQLFVPPLRERRDDIGRLFIHFLRRELGTIGELHHLTPRAYDEPTWIPAGLVSRLARLAWPGNVRQLGNVVRQLAISSRGASEARVDAAVARLLAAADSPRAQTDPDPAVARPGEVDDDEMIAVLRAHEWRVHRAATALGMSRSTLYERMKACDRIRKAEDIPHDELTACYDACDGDLAEMARRLDVSRRSLTIRIKQLGIAAARR